MIIDGLRAPAATAVLRSLGFAVLYATAIAASRWTALEGSDMSMVWPAGGVAAVWFGVQRGAGTLPLDAAAFAGISVAVGLATGMPPAHLAWLAPGIAVQAVVFHLLIGRWAGHLWGAGGTRPLASVDDLLRLGGAALVAGLASAPAPLGLALTGPADAWPILAIWVVRAVVGTALVSCAGLRIGWLIARRGRQVPPPMRPRPSRRRFVEGLAVAVTSVALYSAVFGLSDLPVAFLPLAVTVWLALRFDTTAVMLHDLGAGSAAVVLTLLGHGPFAAIPEIGARAVVVQVFIGTLAFTGLGLAIIRDQREALLVELRRRASDSEARADRIHLLADVTRTLTAAPDVRDAVCDAAQRLTGARSVHLLEPDGARRLVRTAGSRTPTPADVAAADAAVLAAADAAVLAAAGPGPTADPYGRATVGGNAPSGPATFAHQPLLGQTGEPTGCLVLEFPPATTGLSATVVADLEALAQEAGRAIARADLVARLAGDAERDPLTGLANRRRWDSVVAQEIARARRDGHPLTIALLDLDHFKRFNDRLGHLAGDDLLRVFATRAAAMLREVDTIARWGGEEFAVCLPGCPPEHAIAVAERLRAAVPDGQTCTIGLAAWQPGLDAAAVLARADAALYQGKSAGRDRVVVAAD